jgi:Salmonella virulence plasmid 65kDa B protein
MNDLTPLKENGCKQTGNAASVPTIAAPKGGGAIRGIGDKSSVNPTTGTVFLTAPIFRSPGRSEFYPKPFLSYDSGAGNAVGQIRHIGLMGGFQPQLLNLDPLQPLTKGKCP